MDDKEYHLKVKYLASSSINVCLWMMKLFLLLLCWSILN